MSKATTEEMKKEALDRLDSLVKTVGLNPKVRRYFEEDRLYYSYLTGGGFIGSIDKISFDPQYEKTVKDFERTYGVLVYHCVEDTNAYGRFLDMLFVSGDRDEWESERLAAGKRIPANVYELDEDFDEIGDICLDAYQGALVRVG